jgi:hypothetical protein
MDVKYTPKAPKGKSCAVCANFTPYVQKPDLGTCFGHDVAAAGGCNMFKRRASAPAKKG